MNKELIPIEELIKEIENNKYIDCDEVDKYEEIYEYESILYYLKKYIRLNNMINELQWKPIEEYEKPKYDWVLVKYYIEPEFECIPTVAEERFGKWYDRNDNEIIGELRYFMDMQLLDKLKELKEGDV